MNHSTSYQTCVPRYPPPDDMNERIVDAMASAIDDLLSFTAILDGVFEQTGYEIDRAELKTKWPDALEALAARMRGAK